MGLLLRRCSGQGPHLAKTLEPHRFSRFASGFSKTTGISGFLLGWPWEAQSSPGVARDAKVGSQETPGVTGEFGLGIRNEAGQRLIEFCQENALDRKSVV